jgi:hypothetical protein
MKPFAVGVTVRIKGVSSCSGKEGVIEKETTTPPDNKPAYLVNLGDGLIWCFEEEMERKWQI